jgi:hypothetical protein
MASLRGKIVREGVTLRSLLAALLSGALLLGFAVAGVTASAPTASANELTPFIWDCPNQEAGQNVIGKVGDTVDVTIIGPCTFTPSGATDVVTWGDENPTTFGAGSTLVTFSLIRDGFASLTSGEFPFDVGISFYVADFGIFACSVEPPDDRDETFAGAVGDTFSVFINGGCAITSSDVGIVTWSAAGSGDPPTVTNALLTVTLTAEGETDFIASYPGGGRSRLLVAVTVTGSETCSPDQFAGGVGTPDAPFQISNATQLRALATTAGCLAAGLHFRQTAAISLTRTWTPIGRESSPFQGTYDGGGNTVGGLFINDPTAVESGLFGALSGASVSRLTVNGSIQGDSDAGGLASIASNSTIANVHTNVAITLQQSNAGGLIGYVTEGVTITDSSATGNITGGAGNYGGLVGAAFPESSATALTVRRSWASGNASGAWRFIGGLLGGMDAVDSRIIIDQSYATGNVTGGNPGYVGGLFGFASNATVTDSYTRGTVNAGAYVSGGMFGEVYAGSFTRNYGVNQVFSTGARGGISGAIQETPTFTGLIWNNEIGVMDPVNGSSTLSGTTGANTATMKLESTYDDLGWTISTRWSAATTWIICPTFNDGYPFLAAFYTASTDPCAPQPTPGPTPAPIPDPGTTPAATPKPVPDSNPALTPANQVQQAIDKIRGLTPNQIQELTAAELAALPPEAFAVMTPAQIRALQPRQVRALNDEQIRAIQPKALRAMKPRTLKRFTRKQIRALTDEQVQRLRTKQINALGPKRKTSIQQRR